MRKYGSNGRIHSLEELHHRIDAVAQKKLGMSGEQAIEIINNNEWEGRENIDVWLWLKGFVELMSDVVPGRRMNNARIQQES